MVKGDSWRSISKLTRKNRRKRLLSRTKHMRHRSMEIWIPSREDFLKEEAWLPNVSDTHGQWCPWIQWDLTALRSPLSASRVLTWKTCFLTRMIRWWYPSSQWGERCTESWSTKEAWQMWCFGNVHQFSTIPWSVEAIRRMLDQFCGRPGRSTWVRWAKDDLLRWKCVQNDCHQVYRY